MAGDTLPFAKIQDPRVGETANVVVRLALIGPLRVINPGDHRSVTEEVHLYILNVSQGGLESGIFDVGKKSLLIAEFAVPLGIDKAARHQRIESSRVSVHLRFIPEALEDQQLALAWIGLLGGQCDRAERDQKTAADGTNHGLTRFASIPLEANLGKR